jgi:creatinine amidohydrolase
MAHMTFVEVEESAKEGNIILFPVGVIEQHGPHLPLAVDVYGAYLQAIMVKAELEKKKIKALIAPPFYWGINSATGAFGGSFTCREETVISALWDAISCLKQWGFKKVLFINHHMDGKHLQAVDKAIRKARKEIGIQVYWIMDQFFAGRIGFDVKEEHLLFFKTLMPFDPMPPYPDIHAESYETSFMWHYLPHLVRFDIWKKLEPSRLTYEDLLIWRKGGVEARKMTPQGYFGNPGAADPERGRREMEDYGRRVADLIQAFLQGRYAPPPPAATAEQIKQGG